MEYEIEIKNVPAAMVFTHLDRRPSLALERTAYELISQAELDPKESIFCLVEQPNLDGDIQVCCPIHNVDVGFHEKKYKIQVLPRVLVLSAIHYGEYNELKPIFEFMFRYIEKNRLNTSRTYRILFHREKREWDRTKVSRKPAQDYVTEVQIQLFDK